MNLKNTYYKLINKVFTVYRLLINSHYIQACINEISLGSGPKGPRVRKRSKSTPSRVTLYWAHPQEAVGTSLDCLTACQVVGLALCLRGRSPCTPSALPSPMIPVGGGSQLLIMYFE